MILYGHRVTVWGRFEGALAQPWDVAAASHLTVFQGETTPGGRENGNEK